MDREYPEKPSGALRVFCIGDIFGDPSVCRVAGMLPSFLSAENVDFCTANGENADSGSGITARQAETLSAAGVDVITGGNHSLEKRFLWPVLQDFPFVLRPGNFPSAGSFAGFSVQPESARLSSAEASAGDSAEESPALPAVFPGKGTAVVEKTVAGIQRRLCVINVQGREMMRPLDCPFRYTENALADLRAAFPGQTVPVVVDFHGESAAEKEAFCLYFDGRLSAVMGTHTHVQTADARILPGGTACLSDLGMCGPRRSVIGSLPEDSVLRALTQVPLRMRPAEGPPAVQGCLLDLDPDSGKAVALYPVNRL